MSPEGVRSALASDATGPKVRREIEAALMNTQLREKLAGRLGERLADGHQILGRWAVALTASETYAEIFDQHVELYGRVDGLLRFLREGYRQTDPRGFRNRARREYSSPGREADGRNLEPGSACPAASVVGPSYGSARRCYPACRPATGCRTLMRPRE
jgi:hypothetical protein